MRIDPLEGGFNIHFHILLGKLFGEANAVSFIAPLATAFLVSRLACVFRSSVTLSVDAVNILGPKRKGVYFHISRARSGSEKLYYISRWCPFFFLGCQYIYWRRSFLHASLDICHRGCSYVRPTNLVCIVVLRTARRSQNYTLSQHSPREFVLAAEVIELD